ncbi:ATP-binding cassette domain-containing protein [Alicyclobacillus vulcanalis]|uniref:Energy-coupling factor transport system ATP-binding protein n=1 Tax=Alicyclobacillus vulcanalis TaxID=252246 RepID=A0A1N7M0S5_9BACL|nr:ATP-binding cassette domain-containing protein [Alicyclobacillus vulcanalis]SIS79662.1 energy-coupling factor transport system ATP-binding protein [Alicyclobacillus vulcanalis]
MTTAAAGVDRALALEVHNLTVTYDEAPAPALAGVSFSLAKGECLLLIGPSGCGKSTLAMAIAGILPRSIEARVEGEIRLAPEFQAPGKIGYVFQDPDLQFCMHRVDDELAFGLENLCVSRDEMPARMQSALTSVGLEVGLRERHNRFSGGMKQKLAVASALAMDADLVLFDEPTANLDPDSRRHVYDVIRRLKEAGKTVVVIEHRYEPFLAIADAVVELAPGGRLKARHRPEDAPRRPRRYRHRSATVRDGEAPVLEARGLSLRYGHRDVWRDIQVAVRPGEWLAVLGPNGAGKSSLLEVLAGLRRPTAGQVWYRGKEIRQMSAKARYGRIAYAFQNPEYQFLYERVADEIAGRVLGDEVPDDVERELEAFGLAGCAQLSPFGISQGQKRRLAMAVMMRQGADVWLVDEPTYGQDEASERAILDRLDALCEAGKAVIAVTHDLELVAAHADRVMVLADGGVLYDGPPEDLLRDRELLRRARLDEMAPVEEAGARGARGEAGHAPLAAPAEAPPTGGRAKAPLVRWHPDVKAVALLCVAAVALCARTFAAEGWMWALVGALSFGFGWLSPLQMAKRLSPLLLIYAVYLWAFAANAAAPAGAHVVHWLWFDLSGYGALQGLLVVLRTFATVVLAYVLVATTDGTEFMVGLSQSFHLAPKLSYGAMAGTGFLGRFRHDLDVFRMARRVRGREGWWILRPVRYALPLLAQSIRVSERLAIAMEARGFFGPPAERWDQRTYWRRIPLRAADVVAAGIVVAAAIACLVAP